MKKLLYFTTIIGLLFTIVSCEQDGTVYKLSDKVEASFPSTIVNYQMVKEDGNKIVVEMWRGNTKGEAIVPVTITDKTNGVFVAEKEQFDFADGESKAYLTFTYPDLNDFAGEKYDIDLEIKNDEMVSPGGNGAIKISAQRKLTFKSLGEGEFTSEFFEDSWPQEVMKAEEADYYRLPDCYYEGYHIEFSIQDGKVDFATQPMGEKYEGSMIYWVNDSDGSTFDGDTFTFIPAFFVPDLGGGFGEYIEVFVMP